MTSPSLQPMTTRCLPSAQRDRTCRYWRPGRFLDPGYPDAATSIGAFNHDLFLIPEDIFQLMLSDVCVGESEPVVVSTTMLPGMQFMACAFFDALKGGGCKSCACVYVSRRDSFRGEGCMGGQLDVVGWEQRKGSGELSAAV